MSYCDVQLIDTPSYLQTFLLIPDYCYICCDYWHTYAKAYITSISYIRVGFRIMVFNATFNNISVISCRSVLLVEETGVQEKTTDMPQSNDKLYHLILYRVHLARAGLELITLVVDGTGWICSYKIKLPYDDYHVGPAIYAKCLGFLCNVLSIVVCPFVLFFLVIVLFVLLRFTDSDYTFGIFKLFLPI
jgi:hypothetical protein